MSLHSDKPKLEYQRNNLSIRERSLFMAGEEGGGGVGECGSAKSIGKK